ncbi:MAG: cation:proton antiporter subunit C [Lachnospiraceae bacterium]|jgi:multicomponent Na+:H+ antiporter subunit C|nr:cation:proton antiporter subunit C [Lachnospiraceae bacterium]MCI1657255.1 cation:proton antiporter subunit C [Lachnospiraceae bacterium]MCI2195709.1 cation:proton antiporter subunit C [Lachnospiraceae bacterium]
MEAFNTFLAAQGIYILTLVLFFLGIFGMAACGNYLKKLVCMNIMQVAVIFFFLCMGQKKGGTIPVLSSRYAGIHHYINPIPHTLMLTAIVVSLGTTGVGLALLMRIKEKYHSIEEEEIRKRKES